MLNQAARDGHVRMHAHTFLAQLAVEPAHHGNDNNEHPHADGHADEGDERDDGNECALGFEITKAKKQFERQTRHVCGRNCGNKMTSRRLSAPVSIMTSRSIPMPMPPAGGMPCSSASRKSSSTFWASAPDCASSRLRCSRGSFSSE